MRNTGKRGFVSPPTVSTNPGEGKGGFFLSPKMHRLEASGGKSKGPGGRREREN